MSTKNITRPQRKQTFYTAISVITIIAFFCFWEGIVQFGIVSKFYLASPTQVIELFVSKLTNEAPDGALLMAHFNITDEYLKAAKDVSPSK